MTTYLISPVALCIDGLLAGVFLGSGLMEQAAKSLDARTWIRYKQAKERVFGRVMPPFLLSAIGASAAATLLPHRNLAFSVTALLLIVVMVITLVIHLPLNRAVDATSPDDVETEWHRMRDRWRCWHWVRTVAAAAGFITATFLR